MSLVERIVDICPEILKNGGRQRPLDPLETLGIGFDGFICASLNNSGVCQELDHVVTQHGRHHSHGDSSRAGRM